MFRWYHWAYSGRAGYPGTRVTAMNGMACSAVGNPWYPGTRVPRVGITYHRVPGYRFCRPQYSDTRH
eukprot:1613184-Rhodomonas_salina.1